MPKFSIVCGVISSNSLRHSVERYRNKGSTQKKKNKQKKLKKNMNPLKAQSTFYVKTSDSRSSRRT